MVGTLRPVEQDKEKENKESDKDEPKEEEMRPMRFKDCIRTLKEDGQKQYYRLQRWRFSLLNQENVVIDPMQKPEYLVPMTPSRETSFIYKKDYAR